MRSLLLKFIFASAIFLICTPLANGQEFDKCKVLDKALKSVKFSVGRIERVPKYEDKIDDTLFINISVAPDRFNEKDLTLISKKIKSAFCKENRIVVAIFDNKKQSLYYNPEFKENRNSLRGTYVLDKAKNEEYIEFVRGANLMNNRQSAIKLDLSDETKQKK